MRSRQRQKARKPGSPEARKPGSPEARKSLVPRHLLPLGIVLRNPLGRPRFLCQWVWTHSGFRSCLSNTWTASAANTTTTISKHMPATSFRTCKFFHPPPCSSVTSPTNCISWTGSGPLQQRSCDKGGGVLVSQAKMGGRCRAPRAKGGVAIWTGGNGVADRRRSSGETGGC